MQRLAASDSGGGWRGPSGEANIVCPKRTLALIALRILVCGYPLTKGTGNLLRLDEF